MLIDNIKKEFVIKLEEAPASNYSDSYFYLYEWSIRLTDKQRFDEIYKVDSEIWGDCLVQTEHDKAELSLIKCYILLLLHKHYDSAKRMLPAMKALSMLGNIQDSDFVNLAESNLYDSPEFRREVYSEHNRRNASGAKNATHNECIAIMKATWDKYPYSSKNGMVEKIFSHFEGKVSRETLNRWIKQNSFGPKEIVRPVPPFKLVIPS